MVKIPQALLLIGLVACSSRPVTSPRVDKPVAPLPVGSTQPPIEPSAAKAPPEPTDPCPPLKANEVSEDETPSIAGTLKRVDAGVWLEARGISRNAFRTWVRSRDPKNLEDFDADSIFDGEGSCPTLKVGDKGEDALVCNLAVRTSVMRYSAVAFVVRNKHVIPVLEVGYALPAMDWPDARWLDLQLTFSNNGLEADLHDRAKPGTFLVMPPSFCHEHFKRYLACEQAHRDKAPLENVCPQEMSAGKLSFGHMSPTPGEDPIVGGPAALFGCAEALPKLDELVKQTKSTDMYAAEFREDRAFAIKSCKARGRYIWKGDRFVRSPAG